MTRIRVVSVVLVASATVLAGQRPTSDAGLITADTLSALSWRSIGPAMFAGRVADVAGVPGNPDILYVGTASSGLYKSTNGGVTFDSIFDDGNTLSIGAIAAQPDDPDVVYVGTGEGAVRNSVSFGDGIYKTTDGGRTWRHLGLRDTERFSRIAIHPTNARVVLAAAMGHAFGKNTERGIFRSEDGGETWRRTLFVNDTTGASDVAIDPADPSIVYAGMYDYLRLPWTLRSGGPGSGLFRSSDGGLTWTKLTDPALGNGLPGAQLLGRVGVAIARSNPNVVYALIDALEDGVLWRSDDRGRTWRIVSDDNRLNNRPFYYTQVRVDPVDPERVYTLAGSFNLSTDGGQTFVGSGGRMFGDHHALWIDPTRPTRLLCGTDGGFFISNDHARTWDFVNNMPMAQAYHVGVDMDDPYNVLGGFQDHEIWRGPNEKWNQAGVREGDWVRLRYMADGMYAIADPRDPNLIYYNGHFGDITRLDFRTREERYIQPYPPGPNGAGAEREQYRFNWNSPVHMSPSNPDVLYYGGNVVFKTTVRGETWTVISPDLTTDDVEKQRASGGPVSRDNTRAEFHTTILTIAESPRDPNLVWAGTDDGNVQITRDGGKTWTNVAPNITGAPPFSWVASIQASHVDAGTAYVAIDQHRLDDFRPHAFVTADYGRTWRRISEGLRGYAHIVMEDPKEPNLLYAGTELGVFASFDRGASWTDLRLGLPPLAVVDMKVHPRDNDLILGTHARGFYILDDITPLQRLAAAAAGPAPATLFPPMQTTRYIPASDVSALGNRVWVARNAPYGAIIDYYLAETVSSVRIEIRDQGGRIVQTVDGTTRAGLNRVVWDLSEPSSCAAPESSGGRAGAPPAAAGRGGRGRGGPGGGRSTWILAVPGTYGVRMSASGFSSAMPTTEPVAVTLEQPVVVRMDPRVSVAPGDMEEWYREARKIERMECTVADRAARVRSLDAQLAALGSSQVAPAALKAAAAEVRRELGPVGLTLSGGGNPNDPDYENLGGRINWLTIQVGKYSGRPTAAQIEWIERYSQMTDAAAARLDSVVAGSLARLNAGLRGAGLAEIR